jgi:putative FmdB family regulatory protein
VPKYDFRCSGCGHQFELTRSFSQSADPAACPRDGTSATRLFSPPLDLLMYRREPVVDTGPVAIPAGALSCHDHGPPPASDAERADEHTGSRWHAHGYESAADGTPGASHAHGHGPVHAHGHAHAHGHGHSH